MVLDFSEMRGCHVDYSKMTVDVEGGLIWKDVYYKCLKDKRKIAIGGQYPPVGVSGFTLGAGLSPFHAATVLAAITFSK
jgi:FAD/FMN-containing dehydrogenase